MDTKVHAINWLDTPREGCRKRKWKDFPFDGKKTLRYRSKYSKEITMPFTRVTQI
jgi:hypothetical protein